MSHVPMKFIFKLQTNTLKRNQEIIEAHILIFVVHRMDYFHMSENIDKDQIHFNEQNEDKIKFRHIGYAIWLTTAQ